MSGSSHFAPYCPSPLPLPRRRQPLPWEAMPSLLTRIAQSMGYEDVRWIVSPERLSSSLRLATLSTLTRKADYHLLEQLLLLEQATLYNLTLHRFASHLVRVQKHSDFGEDSIERTLLSPALLRKFFLPATYTKVCPLCLDSKEPYDRLYWKCRFVMSCSEHALILLERCFQCQAPIPAIRAASSRCPRCGADYRATLPASLVNAELVSRASSYLLHMLGVDCFKEHTGQEDASSPLNTLPPQEYFHLFECLRYLLNQTLTPEHFSILEREMEVLPSGYFTLLKEERAYDLLLHITLFHKIFTRWPDTFHAFLDLFHRLVKQTYGHGYFAKACHVLFFHSLNAPTFDSIVQKFKAYDDALWLAPESQSDTINQEAVL